MYIGDDNGTCLLCSEQQELVNRINTAWGMAMILSTTHQVAFKYYVEKVSKLLVLYRMVFVGSIAVNKVVHYRVHAPFNIHQNSVGFY